MPSCVMCKKVFVGSPGFCPKCAPAPDRKLSPRQQSVREALASRPAPPEIVAAERYRAEEFGTTVIGVDPASGPDKTMAMTATKTADGFKYELIPGRPCPVCGKKVAQTSAEYQRRYRERKRNEK